MCDPGELSQSTFDVYPELIKEQNTEKTTMKYEAVRVEVMLLLSQTFHLFMKLHLSCMSQLHNVRVFYNRTQILPLCDILILAFI